MKFHKGSKKMKGKMRIFSLQQHWLWPSLFRLTHYRVQWNNLNMWKPQKQLFFQPPWLHPSPLTNVLGSQGATVLLNGPFLFLNPKAKAVVEVAPPPTSPPPRTSTTHPLHLTILWDWIAFDLCEKQWLKAFHFSGLLNVEKTDLFTLRFHCGLLVIHKQGDKMIYAQ